MTTDAAAVPLPAPEDSADLRCIVDQVWEALFGAPADWLESGAPGSQVEVPDDQVTSQVAILGDSAALLTLTTSLRAAEQATRTMLGIADDEPVDPADLADALGEVVNVVGGNYKALTAGAHRLGLPETRQVAAPAHPPAYRVRLGWRDALVTISVYTTPAP